MRRKSILKSNTIHSLAGAQRTELSSPKAQEWSLGFILKSCLCSCCEAVELGGEVSGAVMLAGEKAVVCESVGSSSQTEDFKK